MMKSLKLILVAPLLFLLVLPACRTTVKQAATEQIAACNWPPDTLMISIQGSGMITVRFLWKDPSRRAAPCPPSTFVLTRSQPPQASIPSALRKDSHAPQDTTPADRVAMVLEFPETPTGGNDLYLTKWPQDTTSGGGK